mmetsp:Transcript_48366/g.121871  ORF Transcript_48366/g.121871 Transcript_48366/m.121871 type:complete len:319 (-) Transcript_48366:62-1018(-)
MTQPRWEENQVPGPRRVEKRLAEWRAVATRVAKAQLAARGAHLRVEDANMVLADVCVRTVELTGTVDRSPIEDAVIQRHRGFRVHAGPDQVPAAEAVHDISELLVLRQPVHLRPTRVVVRVRRVRAMVILLEGHLHVPTCLEEPFLPMEKGIVQGASVFLLELPPNAMVPWQLRCDTLLESAPPPHSLFRQPFVEGWRLPTAQITCDRHHLHMRWPQDMDVRVVFVLGARHVRFQELIETIADGTMLAFPILGRREERPRRVAPRRRGGEQKRCPRRCSSRWPKPKVLLLLPCHGRNLRGGASPDRQQPLPARRTAAQ